MRNLHSTVEVVGTILLLLVPSTLAQPVRQSEADRFRLERDRMVSRQIEARGIDHPQVLSAMRAVPRHLFVPNQYRGQAYDDHPLPIGLGQTISQPYIVALMTQLAAPDPDDVVLEVGTGSGYQAAVLAQLVDTVYTVEILQQLGDQARERFKRLGYTNVEPRVADGYYGWEEHGPFDAIVVTAAAEHIPPSPDSPAQARRRHGDTGGKPFPGSIPDAGGKDEGRKNDFPKSSPGSFRPPSR